MIDNYIFWGSGRVESLIAKCERMIGLKDPRVWDYVVDIGHDLFFRMRKGGTISLGDDKVQNPWTVTGPDPAVIHAPSCWMGSLAYRMADNPGHDPELRTTIQRLSEATGGRPLSDCMDAVIGFGLTAVAAMLEGREILVEKESGGTDTIKIHGTLSDPLMEVRS